MEFCIIFLVVTLVGCFDLFVSLSLKLYYCDIHAYIKGHKLHFKIFYATLDLSICTAVSYFYIYISMMWNVTYFTPDESDILLVMGFFSSFNILIVQRKKVSKEKLWQYSKYPLSNHSRLLTSWRAKALWRMNAKKCQRKKSILFCKRTTLNYETVVSPGVKPDFVWCFVLISLENVPVSEM